MIRRPVDRASAVPIETAYVNARIRTIIHVEMYFDFILHIISLWTRFWTSGSLLTRTSYGRLPIPDGNKLVEPGEAECAARYGVKVVA